MTEEAIRERLLRAPGVDPAWSRTVSAQDAEGIPRDMELILEANEDGERVRIFGVEDGNRVRDCILFSSDGALIVTEGGIDLDKVAKLMELQQ